MSSASVLDHSQKSDYSQTLITIGGAQYECKVATGTIREDIKDMGQVQAGTKCAENKVRTQLLEWLVQVTGLLLCWQVPFSVRLLDQES